MTIDHPRPRIGTAGWSIPGSLSHRFAGDGSHLERYARVMDCVEINSSFHRAHRRSTYVRWADSTPESFRFSVKMPREITHIRRLVGVEVAIDDFLEQVDGLGHRLGAILIQLPPSFAFDPGTSEAFFALLRRRYFGQVACEPRERRWFQREADALLAQFNVMRVAADPAIVASGAAPEGRKRASHAPEQLASYHRWHGSPRTYWSSYDAHWLWARAAELKSASAGRSCWCVFDNTASGYALENALSFKQSFD